MPLTKAEIRDRAANELGILTLGQPLQAQDATRIEQAYNETYDYLDSQGLAIWPMSGSVPDRLSPYIISIVAFNCADTYGISEERNRRLTARFVIAEKKIRELVQEKYVSLEEPTNY